MISLTIAGIIAYLHCREPAQMYPTSVRESMCVRTHLLKETGFKEYTLKYIDLLTSHVIVVVGFD